MYTNRTLKHIFKIFFLLLREDRLSCTIHACMLFQIKEDCVYIFKM